MRPGKQAVKNYLVFAGQAVRLLFSRHDSCCCCEPVFKLPAKLSTCESAFKGSSQR